VAAEVGGSVSDDDSGLYRRLPRLSGPVAAAAAEVAPAIGRVGRYFRLTFTWELFPSSLSVVKQLGRRFRIRLWFLRVRELFAIQL